MSAKIALFAASFAITLLGGPHSANAVYITEFLALNTSTLRDEDGTFSDWLELHTQIMDGRPLRSLREKGASAHEAHVSE